VAGRQYRATADAQITAPDARRKKTEKDMNIMKLRRSAERRSGAADKQRSEFRRHSRRSANIARQLLATPLGLSFCFGLGAATGLGASSGKRSKSQSDGEPKAGRIRAVVADASTRLASAVIVGALMEAGSNNADSVGES
jgi:hypothetical protein